MNRTPLIYLKVFNLLFFLPPLFLPSHRSPLHNFSSSFLLCFLFELQDFPFFLCINSPSSRFCTFSAIFVLPRVKKKFSRLLFFISLFFFFFHVVRDKFFFEWILSFPLSFPLPAGKTTIKTFERYESIQIFPERTHTIIIIFYFLHFARHKELKKKKWKRKRKKKKKKRGEGKERRIMRINCESRHEITN